MKPVRTTAERVPGFQAGRFFTIHECEGCRASFATPHTADDALYGRIYENIRFVPGYNRYLQYAEEVRHRRNPLRYLSDQEESYWAVARHLRTLAKPPAELGILEVGCGMGYFTYALARAGYDVLGVDLSSEAIDWAREHYGPYFSTQSLRELEAAGRRYDVVVMNQLIEHVPDIHPFLGEAMKLLKHDGVVLITTPNKTSYANGVWRTELPPVHLWWLGEDALRYLGRRYGCEVSFVDFTTFHRWMRRGKNSDLESFDRPQVFDEAGRLLTHAELKATGPFKRLLDRVGVRRLLRAARTAVDAGDRWRGPRGEVMAAILRKTATRA